MLYFVERISINSRAMATKPETGMVSARRVASTCAAAASRAGSMASDLRLCRSIFRRWPKAAAATCSSARRSQGSGLARGTRRTTEEVTFGCGTNAAGALDRDHAVCAKCQQSARQSAGTGTNLDHGRILQRTGGASDPRREVEVEKEILTERFACRKRMFADDVAQRRQVVDRAHFKVWPPPCGRQA